jgi:hypothetical protein
MIWPGVQEPHWSVAIDQCLLERMRGTVWPGHALDGAHPAAHKSLRHQRMVRRGFEARA